MALILAAGALVPAPALAGDDVDLLLVLAADVSRSIDAAKFQLQRDGYAAAISDPRVLDTIKSGHLGRIGLTFVEWSGVGAQHVVIDWTAIGDGASAKDFGDRLLEAPRSFADRTSICGAIEFAMDQFTHTPFAASRRIIDISGDGTNNAGRDVASVARRRRRPKASPSTGSSFSSENPMSWNPDHTNPPGGLDNYYRNNVIGGPGAFVMVAQRLQLVRPGHDRQADRRGGRAAPAESDALLGPLTPPRAGKSNLFICSRLWARPRHRRPRKRHR